MFSSQVGTQTVKMQFDTFLRKIQNRCTLHPCEDEKYSGFSYNQLTKSLTEMLVRIDRIGKYD